MPSVSRSAQGLLRATSTSLNCMRRVYPIRRSNKGETAAQSTSISVGLEGAASRVWIDFHGPCHHHCSPDRRSKHQSTHHSAISLEHPKMHNKSLQAVGHRYYGESGDQAQVKNRERLE